MSDKFGLSAEERNEMTPEQFGAHLLAQARSGAGPLAASYQRGVTATDLTDFHRSLHAEIAWFKRSQSPNPPQAVFRAENNAGSIFNNSDPDYVALR